MGFERKLYKLVINGPDIPIRTEYAFGYDKMYERHIQWQNEYRDKNYILSVSIYNSKKNEWKILDIDYNYLPNLFSD